MEWDISVIARRDSNESAASNVAVSELAVPDTSRDEEMAVRLSQELNKVRYFFYLQSRKAKPICLKYEVLFHYYQGATQRNEDQVDKDREFALKLQLQMNENNHRYEELEARKLSDAFKDPENARDESDEFPDDAFEGDNVFDNIRRQGGLQRFIGDSGGEPTCLVLPSRAAFSPGYLSMSSLSDDDSPDERKNVDESSIKVTPPPSIPSPKKRKVAGKAEVKKKSVKELFENVRTMSK